MTVPIRPVGFTLKDGDVKPTILLLNGIGKSLVMTIPEFTTTKVNYGVRAKFYMTGSIVIDVVSTITLARGLKR